MSGMTVAHLIEALAQPDQPVYVEGDETGDWPVLGVTADVRLRFTQGRLAVVLEVGPSDYGRRRRR